MNDLMRCFLLNLKDVVPRDSVRRIFLQAFNFDIFDIYAAVIYEAVEPFDCVILQTDKGSMVFGWIGMDENSTVVLPSDFVEDFKASLWKNYEAEC